MSCQLRASTVTMTTTREQPIPARHFIRDLKMTTLISYNIDTFVPESKMIRVRVVVPKLFLGKYHLEVLYSLDVPPGSRKN
ncbi:hypothetical protein E2C01_006217 [Portunus trituberculatus]|uniref:Uncharacterized protein n=1 Tax=Portunus trituberculatus TaxID=210409 RepID=A0A5B7CVR2_PORTR|nr:hypothetical protein [Portunus trituberculatus]